MFNKKRSRIKEIIPLRDVIGCDIIDEEAENSKKFTVRYQDNGTEKNIEYEAENEKVAADIIARLRYLIVTLF